VSRDIGLILDATSAFRLIWIKPAPRSAGGGFLAP